MLFFSLYNTWFNFNAKKNPIRASIFRDFLSSSSYLLHLLCITLFNYSAFLVTITWSRYNPLLQVYLVDHRCACRATSCHASSPSYSVLSVPSKASTKGILEHFLFKGLCCGHRLFFDVLHLRKVVWVKLNLPLQ